MAQHSYKNMSNARSSYTDKVCIVTGGGSGIGKALCIQLGIWGAKKVLVVDLNLKSAESVARSLPLEVGIALCLNCGTERGVREAIQVASQFGGAQVVLANAGVGSYGGFEVPDDEWQRVIQVNVMQSVYFARHLFPIWERYSIPGKFLITASAAGLLAQIGSLPYTVSKRAAVSIAEWLSMSYLHKGIQVSCLCPQLVETTMMPPVMSREMELLGRDGILKPGVVAIQALEELAQGKFLILPHPKVLGYINGKAKNPDSWILGMNKVHQKIGDSLRSLPNTPIARM